MPQLGKPMTLQEQAFGNVQMAPRNRARLAGNREVNANEKERLLNNLTGYKKKSIFKEGPHNKMGKDEFLKLLTHQLKNQDPMKPMDQTKMSGELAQFSQLEQLSNLNSKFDNMLKNDNMEEQFYGASFLGKEVVTSGRSLKYEGEGTDSDILFSLDKNASKVLVRIYDKNNAMVGEMWKENIGRGNQNITWDGTQLDTTAAAPGDYRVQVYAWDYQAEPIDVKTKVTGKVESVFFENGQTVLMVDGKKVFLRDVDSFHMPGQAIGKKTQEDMPKQNIPQQANSLPTNLPIAPSINSQVQSNTRLNKQQGIRAYNNVNNVSTGITDVYDVE